MALALARLFGLALTVACWYFASSMKPGGAWHAAMIWGAPLLAFPISLLGRKALDAQPGIQRTEWANVIVHYAMMISLGVSLFPALRLVLREPVITVPVLAQISWALVTVTGAGTLMTVLNLALRGLGAPFAVKLSSRLATDWMYAWTRNPMVLCTLACFFSLGLRHQSAWFPLLMAVSVSPGWIFFVKIYEERELELRFGSSYKEYRARTPFLWPRRPPRTTAQHARKVDV